MEKKYALIGAHLSHSYSPKIHAELVGYNYGLVEIAQENLRDFVCGKEYAGYNVTSPYKKEILKYYYHSNNCDSFIVLLSLYYVLRLCMVTEFIR